jgi:hypothetical protein
MEKKLIKELQLALKSTEQSNIFAPSVNEDRLKEVCVQYLKYYGYTVVSPQKFERKVLDAYDLISLFYGLLKAKRPNDFATSYNLLQDRAIAKRFIQSRIEATGASKERALDECGEIVKTIFDNYDDFNFNFTPSFFIFGQSKFRWVTDKALNIMNAKVKDAAEKVAEDMRQKAVDLYETEDGYNDLDELLSKMEDNN